MFFQSFGANFRRGQGHLGPSRGGGWSLFPSLPLSVSLPWVSFRLVFFGLGFVLSDRQGGPPSVSLCMGIFRAGGDFHFKGYFRPFLVSGGVVPYPSG